MHVDRFSKITLDARTRGVVASGLSWRGKRSVSRFTAIRACSKALKTLLESHITDSSDPYVGGVEISLSSPKELREGGTSNAVSLWLYQVERNAELLNQPRPRPAPDLHGHRPFPVNLHYLVTPVIEGEPLREHALMGRILQVLHSSASIEPTSFLDSPETADLTLFRVSFQPLELEELTRIWDALKEPYQLSAAYLVQLVEIDSLVEPDVISPVIDSRIDVGVIGA